MRRGADWLVLVAAMSAAALMGAAVSHHHHQRELEREFWKGAYIATLAVEIESW